MNKLELENLVIRFLYMETDMDTLLKVLYCNGIIFGWSETPFIFTDLTYAMVNLHNFYDEKDTKKFFL